LGIRGAKIGLLTVGSSVLIQDLLTKFGFTPQKVLTAAEERIARCATQTA
jgi:transketolase